jgi:hypothetical protein
MLDDLDDLFLRFDENDVFLFLFLFLFCFFVLVFFVVLVRGGLCIVRMGSRIHFVSLLLLRWDVGDFRLFGFAKQIKEFAEGFADVQGVVEEPGALAVGGAHAVEAEVGVAVVSGHDDKGVGNALLKFQAGIDGFVEGDQFMHGGDAVAIVAGVIDASAFDLEDEMRVALEPFERGLKSWWRA